MTTKRTLRWPANLDRAAIVEASGFRCSPAASAGLPELLGASTQVEACPLEKSRQSSPRHLIPGQPERPGMTAHAG